MQGTRFATVAEMEAQIHEAARLERPEWPARQRAKLQFARCFWFARQGRIEEALACARRQVAICREGGVEVAALYAMSNVTLMESLLGRPREALEHARTAIARLHALGADVGAGHLYFSEMIALSDAGSDRTTRSSPRAMRIRACARRRRVTGCCCRWRFSTRCTAGWMRPRASCGFDDVLRARSGENASVVAPLLATASTRCWPPGLSRRERARLAAEGAALHDEEAFRLAFGDTA